MDRRSARRFDLRVPVICKWQDHQGSQSEMAGFSRDIGAAGVFVITPAGGPSPGTAVEINVSLPPLTAQSHGLQLKSHGQVVRRETVEDGFGVGIACTFRNSEHAQFIDAVGRDRKSKA